MRKLQAFLRPASLLTAIALASLTGCAFPSSDARSKKPSDDTAFIRTEVVVGGPGDPRSTDNLRILAVDGIEWKAAGGHWRSRGALQPGYHALRIAYEHQECGRATFGGMVVFAIDIMASATPGCAGKIARYTAISTVSFRAERGRTYTLHGERDGKYVHVWVSDDSSNTSASADTAPPSA